MSGGEVDAERVAAVLQLLCAGAKDELVPDPEVLVGLTHGEVLVAILLRGDLLGAEVAFLDWRVARARFLAAAGVPDWVPEADVGEWLSEGDRVLFDLVEDVGDDDG